MTNEVIKLAVDYAKDNNIKHIVIASITGNSVPALVESFDGDIICVTHGFFILRNVNYFPHFFVYPRLIYDSFIARILSISLGKITKASPTIP